MWQALNSTFVPNVEGQQEILSLLAVFLDIFHDRQYAIFIKLYNNC